MKDQYFGDVNDYVKYGLLRCLAEAELRVGVCWMLTPGDGSGDGGKTGYLSDPLRWRWHDPALFDALRDSVNSGERRVGAVERRALIPCGSYFEEFVPDGRSAREAWGTSALSALATSDVVFFDPDNGLEVGSIPIGAAGSKKYVAWSDLTAAWDRGASLVVFQHFARVGREGYTRDLTARVAAKTGGAKVVPLRTAHVLFLVAAQSKHQPQIERALELMSARWGSRIQVVPAASDPPFVVPAVGADGGTGAGRAEMSREVSRSALQEIESALARYRAGADASRLQSTTKQAYIRHAETFVQWMKGEFDPSSST